MFGLDWWVGVLWTEPVGLLVAERLPTPKPAVGKGNKTVKTDPESDLTTTGQFNAAVYRQGVIIINPLTYLCVQAGCSIIFPICSSTQFHYRALLG